MSDVARLEAIALVSLLNESLRSGLLFGNLDEPLDDYGKRIVRVILAALSRVQPEPKTDINRIDDALARTRTAQAEIDAIKRDVQQGPGTNIGEAWDRARDARQGVVAEIPLAALKTQAPMVEGEALLREVLKAAYTELFRTYGDAPRVRTLFDQIDAALAYTTAPTPPAGEPR